MDNHLQLQIDSFGWLCLYGRMLAGPTWWRRWNWEPDPWMIMEAPLRPMQEYYLHKCLTGRCRLWLLGFG
ncbi:hypothetical protein VTJ04DRAFT_3310 [Mycothermus thermophilus]|uniref:uncharacterized protein n=1 Tax=Humicola insolens TaxID=85995 RepID=UPI0037427EE0